MKVEMLIIEGVAYGSKRADLIGYRKVTGFRIGINSAVDPVDARLVRQRKLPLVFAGDVLISYQIISSLMYLSL